MYIVNGNRPKLSKNNTYRLMLKNNVCQQGSHGLAAKTLKRWNCFLTRVEQTHEIRVL